MKLSATTARKINIFEDFGINKVSIEAIDTNLFMLRNPGAATIVRKEESFDTASAYSSNQYTVADASIYRLNEIVTVFANNGTTRKGRAKVTAIDTNTDKITIVIIPDFTTKAGFTPANNDKIQLKMDEFIKKGQFTILKPQETQPEILLIAAEETEGDNCSIEIENEIYKKKK